MTSYLKASLWLFAAAPHVPERCLSSPEEDPTDRSRVVLDVDTLDALASTAGCKEYMEVQYAIPDRIRRERPLVGVNMLFPGFSFARALRQILVIELAIFVMETASLGANPRGAGNVHLDFFPSCLAHGRLKRGLYDSQDIFRIFHVVFCVARASSPTSGARRKSRMVRDLTSGGQETWCSIECLLGARRPADTRATSSKTSQIGAVTALMATWCWVEVGAMLKGRGHDTTVVSSPLFC